MLTASPGPNPSIPTGKNPPKKGKLSTTMQSPPDSTSTSNQLGKSLPKRFSNRVSNTSKKSLLRLFRVLLVPTRQWEWMGGLGELGLPLSGMLGRVLTGMWGGTRIGKERDTPHRSRAGRGQHTIGHRGARRRTRAEGAGGKSCLSGFLFGRLFWEFASERR